jgi:hypothetical protein
LRRRKIQFIYVDSGGGHRAAAKALEAVICELQRPWEVRLSGILDLLNLSMSQEVYNIMLRRGWTLGTAQLIPLIPHYNRTFKEALSRVCPASRLVPILMDIADYPPHFWIERQDQYMICGSSRAVTQARSL